MILRLLLLSLTFSKAWQVNLGPVQNVPTSISVCIDGSTLVAEAGAPLIRVDSAGIVRSIDWVIGSSRVVCTSNGFAELEDRKVTLHRFPGGRRSEYSIPSPVRNAIQLPNSDLLLITDSGPMLLSDLKPLAAWGQPDPDLPDAFLAYRGNTLAVVYPRRIEFRDFTTFRSRNVQVIPIARTDRETYFGAAFLRDGRLLTQSRSSLLAIDPFSKAREEIDRSYGLLHGAGADGCPVFSRFTPALGKLLRKRCVTGE